MWVGHGVTDDDRLDRDAAKQVLRRAARLARPQRKLALATLGFVTLATSTAIESHPLPRKRSPMRRKRAARSRGGSIVRSTGALPLPGRFASLPVIRTLLEFAYRVHIRSPVGGRALGPAVVLG